jgi:hypothetical protein
MSVDEEEWECQERALQAKRGDIRSKDESRLQQYRTLWTILARDTSPGLPEDFASRVALIARLQSEQCRRLDRRFEMGLAAAMLAMMTLVAGALSACFGTHWLRFVLVADPWVQTFLICLAFMLISGPFPLVPGARKILR